MPDKFAEDQLKKFNKVESLRTNWESLWQEVAKYFQPLKEDITSTHVKGSKKGNLIHTNFGVKALDEYASGLHLIMTPTTNQWFGYDIDDRELKDDPQIKEYLSEVTDIVFSELNADGCNFTEKMLEVFREIGCFGTCGLTCELDKDQKYLRFTVRNVKELYLSFDSDGRVDYLARKFKYSAKQIMDKWGNDPNARIHADIRLAMQDDSFKEFDILQIVQKNPDYNPESDLSFPWQVIYIYTKQKETIGISGFHDFPISIFQWNIVDSINEVYSRSQAMKVLPAMKMLDEIEKIKIAASEKFIRPPLVVSGDFDHDVIDLSAGALNFLNSSVLQGKNAIDKLIDIDPSSLSHTKDDIEILKTEIREMFFHEHLKVIRDPRATATQVLEAKDQGLQLLSPYTGTIQTTGFTPLLKKVYRILDKAGILPEKPESLDEEAITVRYKNAAQKVQELNELNSIDRFTERMSIQAEINPQVLDWVNQDEIVKRIADITGLRQEMLREEKAVDEIRDSREQQQANEQQAINSERLVDSVSKISNAGLF